MFKSDNWGDLKTRVFSAAVLALSGVVAMWLGGLVLLLCVSALVAAAFWELWRMIQPQRENIGMRFAILAAVLVFVIGFKVPYFHMDWQLLYLLIPPLGIAAAAQLSAERWGDRIVLFCYGLLILLAAWGMVALRDQGLVWAFFLVAVVVASDTMGYFAGRLLGGPKFWPAISPKKTWSGTVAGWVGAAIVGALFAPSLGWMTVPMAVVLALAAQFGDIAESAIKRYAGVKDSSDLIPGHGGVMDRFDALFAVVALFTVLRLGTIAIYG